MIKKFVTIVVVALFVGAIALSAEATSGTKQSQLPTSIDKTYSKAIINLAHEQDIKFDSKFHVFRNYFDVTITGTLQHPAHVSPFPVVGWLLNFDYDILPGSTVEITCPYLRLLGNQDEPPAGEGLFMLAMGRNMHVKVI